VTVVLYYGDFVSDLLVFLELQESDQAGADNASWVVLGAIIVYPVILSMMDLVTDGGMGLFGVVLNLTNIRMLYWLGRPLLGDDTQEFARASRSAADGKLIEAVLESMPQLYIQAAVVLLGLVNGPEPLVSIVISILSTAYAVTHKLLQITGVKAREQPLAAAGTALFFVADSTSRAFAVAMVVAAQGVHVVTWAGVYLAVELAVRVGHAMRHDKSWDNFRVTSALLSLFSSFPLTRAASERHWLCANSTVFTVAMIVASWSTSTASATALYIAVVALVVKVAAYTAIVHRLGADSSSGIDTTGLAMMALSSNAEDQQSSWTASMWAKHLLANQILELDLREKPFAMVGFRGAMLAAERGLKIHNIE
jgi:hypothetical protein